MNLRGNPVTPGKMQLCGHINGVVVPSNGKKLMSFQFYDLNYLQAYKIPRKFAVEVDLEKWLKRGVAFQYEVTKRAPEEDKNWPENTHALVFEGAVIGYVTSRKAGTFNIQLPHVYVYRQGALDEFAKELCIVLGLESDDKTKPPRVNLMYGLDPEFTIIDTETRERCSADQFLLDSRESQIGCDGNVETVEIRPDPASTPGQLTENVGIILQSIRYALPGGYDLTCGGGEDTGVSIGCHIHISEFPDEVDKIGAVDWLETLLGDFIRKIPGAKRPSSSYGKRGDYREVDGKPHNGIEWRSMPEVLVSKEITLAVFTAIDMIMDTYFSVDNLNVETDDIASALSSLNGFEEKRKILLPLIKFVEKGTFVNKMVLKEWFNEIQTKDPDAEVRVNISTLTDTNDFNVYSKSSKFKHLILTKHDRGATKIFLSSQARDIIGYIVKNLGFIATVSDELFDLPGIKTNQREETLIIALGEKCRQTISARSRGSRNGFKVFAQDVVREL